MRNIVDPQQNLLFDLFQGLFSQIGRKVIDSGSRRSFVTSFSS
jgi:hypothetical protein